MDGFPGASNREYIGLTELELSPFCGPWGRVALDSISVLTPFLA
jgi:hypothetical protein